MRSYSLLLFESLTLSIHLKCLSPLGLRSSRSGSGAFLFPLRGMVLARDAVPHGGAKNMPTTAGLASQEYNNLTPSAVVRSAIDIGAATFADRMWSTPKQLNIPKCLRLAVTRLVPANTSNALAGCGRGNLDAYTNEIQSHKLLHLLPCHIAPTNS